jgi:Uma2 family endonuclease
MLSQAKPVRKTARGRSSTSANGSSRVVGEMTYEQFLRLDESIHAEWVDGKVIEMPAVTDEHSALQAFFMKVIGVFVDAHQLGEIRGEPFQMKMNELSPGRSPDVLFVAKRNLSRLKKMFLHGPADLVIEIVSTGTLAVDRGPKYSEYEAGGVREYWIVDPIRKQADFYARGRDGLYRRLALDEDGIVWSVVLKGLWLKTEWLWKKPLPSAMSVLREWKLV